MNSKNRKLSTAIIWWKLTSRLLNQTGQVCLHIALNFSTTSSWNGADGACVQCIAVYVWRRNRNAGWIPIKVGPGEECPAGPAASSEGFSDKRDICSCDTCDIVFCPAITHSGIQADGWSGSVGGGKEADWFVWLNAKRISAKSWFTAIRPNVRSATKIDCRIGADTMENRIFVKPCLIFNFYFKAY